MVKDCCTCLNKKKCEENAFYYWDWIICCDKGSKYISDPKCKICKNNNGGSACEYCDNYENFVPTE